jgi:hypothetical protein
MEVCMPHVRSNYRNELFVRIGDATLEWIDTQRGQEARSTYVRRVLEQEARRDLPQEVDDDNLRSHAG